jgi:hypothetical protein
MPSETMQATGGLEHLQQVVVGMPHPHGTVELHTQRFGDKQGAQLCDAFAVGGKQVIVDVHVADPEPVAKISQMGVDIGRRIVAVALFENRAVAIGALVGASPAGDHGGPRRADIAEQRQVVALRETRSFA